ncbi:UNVERIFIED_CONTAM: hypothetical protein RMT77_015458 [Armadillidium vulgare]
MKQFTTILTLIVLVTLAYKTTGIDTSDDSNSNEDNLRREGKLGFGLISGSSTSLSALRKDVDELKRQNIAQEASIAQIKESMVTLQRDFTTLGSNLAEFNITSF